MRGFSTLGDWGARDAAVPGSRLTIALIACMRTLNIFLARNDTISMARDVRAGNVAATSGNRLSVASVACERTCSVPLSRNIAIGRLLARRSTALH